MPSKLRFASIGDSLTQGFMSGAIKHTGIAMPAMIARALDLEVPLDFRVARIPGPGLPLNIEDFLRWAESQLGTTPSDAAWLAGFLGVASRYLDRVEDYYERGNGRLWGKYGGVFHNLAVWGFTVYDSRALTPRRCDAAIQDKEGWIDDDFLGIPSAPMYRTAQRILNPLDNSVRRDDSQLDALRRLVEGEGGLDVLVIWLGANDCLRTVVTLEIDEMAPPPFVAPVDPLKRDPWNLTSSAQFKTDYTAFASQVQDIVGANTKVFVGTVPHVTIPPITTGLGEFDGTYFDHYGRFFATKDNFSPLLNKSLKRADAKRIDSRIDEFNTHIKAAVGLYDNWHLVDTGKILDQLAVKRNRQTAIPANPLIQYYANRKDHPLLALQPVPSILMLELDADGHRTQGGLFSLDGVHPSTIGYGLIAEAFLAAMQHAQVPGADPLGLPWRSIIAQDTLLQSPPRLWRTVRQLAQHHATWWDLVFRAFS